MRACSSFRHFRAEPVLCESFTASEDGKTYRYTLVSGVSFSDGTPLTAQDAAASLRAAQQSALYSGRLAHMLSVTADDDRTLTVTLDTAYENFSLMLDVPIVSAATVQSSTPLGTSLTVTNSWKNSPGYFSLSFVLSHSSCAK